MQRQGHDSPNEDGVLEEQQKAQDWHEEEAPGAAAGPRLGGHAHRYHAHVHQGQNVGRQEGSYQQ